MKIYTKKGDQGKTQLLGGTSVYKYHDRVVAYGTIDELNAFIGHIYDQDISIEHKKFLKFIQIQLLNLGSIIASDGETIKIKTPIITIKEIDKIEKEIDKIEEQLKPLTQFILPSGHPIASLCHIARTICRRAEREVVMLSSKEKINSLYIIILNRLSDYLFVLSRFILKENNRSETYWK